MHLTKNNKLLFISNKILLDSSVKKMKSLLQSLKNLDVNNALLQLYFCNNPSSRVLFSSISTTLSYFNSISNSNINSLFVKQITLSKLFTLFRTSIRARGRIDKIKKRYLKMTIILESQQQWVKK